MISAFPKPSQIRRILAAVIVRDDGRELCNLKTLRTGRFYVRKPAVSFKADVALMLARRRMPDAKAYRVESIIYLPKGKRGYAYNFNKVILDALQAAGAFTNDSKATRVKTEVRRDWSNPRTEITISVFNHN